MEGDDKPMTTKSIAKTMSCMRSTLKPIENAESEGEALSSRDSPATTMPKKRKMNGDVSNDDISNDNAEDVATLKNIIKIVKRSEKRLKKIECQLSTLVKTVDELDVRIRLSEHEDNEVLSAAVGHDRDTSDEEDHPAKDKKEKMWFETFKKLRQYRIEHGHCEVPNDHPTLGLWVKTQRRTYSSYMSATGRDKMKPERIPMLESIGFYWGIKYPKPPTWDEMFEQLQNYHRIIGGYDVPFHESNPSALAKWMAYQRKEYRRFKKGRDTLLTKEQIKKLNKIGIDWEGPRL